MLITLLSAGLLMGAYFLLLYAGVGLIQDKRFFSSAPRENLDAIPDRKPQRFPGAHALGWALAALANRARLAVRCRTALPQKRRDWGVTGSHQFGYNKGAHLRHFLLYLPLSAALAGICTLF